MRKFKTIGLLGLVLLISLTLMNQPLEAKATDETTQYHITVELDKDNKIISGTEVVEYTNRYEEDLNDLVFHLYPDSYGSIDTIPAIGMSPNEKLKDEERGDIDIEKVFVGDKEMNFTEDKQILRVHLNTPLKDGNKLRVKIQFKLKLPYGRHRLGYHNDVISLTNWYPILSIYDKKKDDWDVKAYYPIGESNYSDVADYHVTMKIPNNYVVASTGVSEGEKIEDSFKTVELKAEQVRDFVALLSDNYKVITKNVGDIRINSYYLEDEIETEKVKDEENARVLLDMVSDAVEFYNEAFGDYPYQELDIVESYLSGGAMEYPQLIQMGKYNHIDLSTNMENERVPWIIEAAVHETAHQWWYVTVGNNEYKEPVMDESLTVYSTALYFEKKYHKYHRNGIAMQIRSRIYPESTLPIHSSVDAFRDWGEYTRVIYNKGPIVFEDLRIRVGEEKLLKILQTYFDRFMYQNATLEDFLGVVEEVSGVEVKEEISKAMETEDYYPTHVLLTEEENKFIRKNDEIRRLKMKEETVGLNISSFLLRGLEGESLCAVIPTELTDQEKEAVASYIENLKQMLYNNYGINLTVKKDSESIEKNQNLLLLGNSTNNTFIHNIGDDLPIIITSKGILMDDITIRDTNASGIFITENPADKEHVTVVSFWNKNVKFYDLLWGNSTQFIINFNNKELRGMLN